MLVFQRDRQPVDLHFGDVFAGAEFLLQLCAEGQQLFFVKYIGQAAHRHAVAHLFEPLRYATAHPMRRRGRRGQFGILGFQPLKGFKHTVVLTVLDDGRVQLVIQARMLLQLAFEALHLSFDLFLFQCNALLIL